MTVEECLVALKGEVKVQAEQIRGLKETIENFREDIKELFGGREDLSSRVVAVEAWQENFEKNHVNRLAVLGVVLAAIDVIAIIAAFVIGRGT